MKSIRYDADASGYAPHPVVSLLPSHAARFGFVNRETADSSLSSPPAVATVDSEREAAPIKPPRRQGLSARALQRACAYMDEHIGESITLDDLAAVACVSRFHFARQFRISTGQSPMAHFLAMRIERAKELLVQDGMTVSRAADMLGFFDQSHFARTFRRLVGVSPREYVRKLR